MSLAQAIIGSAIYSGPVNIYPVGQFNWNGTPSNYSYTSAIDPTNITNISYKFPNNTTANTTSYDGSSYQSTYSLGPITNYWFDFWVYPTAFNRAILTEMDNNTGAGYYYNMLEIDNNGRIYAGVWNGGNITSFVTTDKLTLNAWNHIYFYYNGSTLNVEINGGSTASTSAIIRSGPGNSFIGVGYYSATSMFTSNQFQGYIETIYASSTSVASRYNSTKSKYQAQPVFALRAADYTSNGTWTDAIAGKSFTMYNTPYWSNINGGQIRFNSANSEYGDTGDAQSLSPLSSFTIQGVFQVQTATQSGSPCLFTENWPGLSKINYAIGYINDSNQIDAGFFDGNGGYWNVLTAKSSPSTNTWYDVVCSFYGPTKELRVYLDGVLVSNTIAPGTASSDNTGYRVARRWDDAYYFDSTVKDINIWSGVMTPSEIARQHIPYNSLV